MISENRKQANVSKIPLLVLPRPSKIILAKSKYYKKKPSSSSSPTNNSQLYVQVSKNYIKDIVKIKKNFLNLSAKKIEEVHRILNNNKKNKPKINIITKDFSRKQIIIPMSLQNTKRIMVKSNKHIVNINRALKDIKSDVVADFIYVDNNGMIITTNKVAANLDLNIIEKYIKNVDKVNTSEVISPRLPQFKSYFKILGIPSYVKDTNLPIISDIIKNIL